jgi:type I restriction enzyme R subunit
MPNAVFIGFTGTPLLKTDAKTSLEVFGGYIHTHKFSEGVEEAGRRHEAWRGSRRARVA